MEVVSVRLREGEPIRFAERNAPEKSVWALEARTDTGITVTAVVFVLGTQPKKCWFGAGGRAVAVAIASLHLLCVAW